MLVIDDREATQHPDLVERLKIPNRIERLGSADYAFLDRNNEPEGIERCEISNLMQKIRNRELESQLTRCDLDYNKVILLIEGVYDDVGGFVAHYKKTRRGDSYFRTRVESHFRYKEVKACLVRLSELGIEILETDNFDCSVKLIETIYEQRRKPEEAHTMFKKLRPVVIPTKLSANPVVPRLLALCPRMTEKVAIRLVNKYDTIWKILQVPDKELLEIEGLGKIGIDNMKKAVGKDVQ